LQSGVEGFAAKNKKGQIILSSPLRVRGLSCFIKAMKFMKQLFAVCFVCILANALMMAQTGKWQWANNPSETNIPGCVNYRVATDKWGNVYTGGYFFSDTVVYGGFTLINAVTDESTSNALLVKYNNQGIVQWALSAGGTGNEFVTGVGTDSAGNVYISGYYTSASVTFGNITLNNLENNSTSDIFLAKFDSGGQLIWAKSLGGNGNDAVENMVCDAAGNTYICGYFYSTALVVGNSILNSYSGGNYNNAFAAKYDAAGNPLWGATGGGSDDYSDAVGITVSPSGMVYATGFFRSNKAVFGSDTLYNYGADSTADIFVAKYSAAGNLQWLRQAGGTDIDEPAAITFAPDESVYITGFYYSSACAFGSDTITNTAAYYYSFLTKYDSSGNALWVDSVSGNNGNVSGDDVATDSKGNVYILGDFYADSTAIGTSFLANSDSTGTTNDIFIAAYNANNNPLWANSYGGKSYDQPYSLRFDIFNDLYVAGYFSKDTIAFGSDTLESYNDTVNSIALLAQLACLYDPVVTQADAQLISSPAVSYQWYLNDTALVGETSQTLQVVRSGNYFVITGQCQLSSDTTYFHASGISSAVAEASLTVYPNPVNSELIIESNLLTEANLTPFVFDLAGRKIELPFVFEPGKIVFDTESLSSGMYVISIGNGAVPLNCRFVKSHQE
jgi:hypothetical protein